MANGFSKEEVVAFEDIIQGFDDALVPSRNIAKYRTDQTMMARTNDIIWRPQPYIAQSFDGTDQTANFVDSTQLSVPATIGYEKSAPWIMTAKEMRDALQENRLGSAAKQKLASDINVAILRTASMQGTLFVKRSAAAAGYDDMAQADTIMNEQGVPHFERFAALSSRDYNAMANNLQVASRSFGNQKSDKAYETSYVGRVAGFDTYKLDYAVRIPAAAGGGSLTINTLDAGAQYYIPKATQVASTGEMSNVDNRFQTVTISSTTNVAAGDAFTIANVEAVNHITKESTGQLKSFRVISVDSATTMTISPPLITNQVANSASAQYQNCTVTSKSSTAAITFLNTVAGPANVFWQRDALEILPGRYEVPTDAGTAVMRATTENGIDVVWQKWYDIKTMKIFYRLDTLFGVVNKQPEMSGLIMFSQT
jgi:hypothetical protein